MNTHLPLPDASYSSPSQQARAMTEQWVAENAYCPACGQPLERLPNNTKAADFVCPQCQHLFELKSTKNRFHRRIRASAYDALVKRLQSDNSPHLFLLAYQVRQVTSFCVVPRRWFTPDIIEKCKPLAPTAKRAGLVLGNILLKEIPDYARVYYLQNSTVQSQHTVMRQFAELNSLSGPRTWYDAVQEVVANLQHSEFRVADVYAHIAYFRLYRPNNHNIKAKIRQQLQLLRDQGQIEFVGRGHYRRVT